MFDFFNNSVMENRTRNKKTVRRLLDKYGTLDNFMQNSTMAEDLEYKLAQGDSIVDEVEQERQAMMKAMNSLPKQHGSSLDDNDMMRNANLLKPTVGTSIFDTENGKMTPLKYMLNYPNMPMPPLEYFLEQNKKYANNRLSSIQSDASVGSKEMEKNTFNQDVFINKTMRPIIENNEGLVPYPYLDTAGLITIGIGANINSNPLSMDWYYKNPDTGEMRHLDKENPNDLMLINSELDKLKNEPKGKDASYYEKITNLRIADEFLNNEYYKRVTESIDDIRYLINEHNKNRSKKIESFDKMPTPLQIVMIDMVYNLGRDGFSWKKTKKIDDDGNIFFVGYPSFWKALENHDLSNMIKESKRFSKGKELSNRNNETRKALETLYEYGYK